MSSALSPTGVRMPTPARAGSDSSQAPAPPTFDWRWIFLLLGLSGGGAGSTLLAGLQQPDSIDAEEVRAIVQRELEQNNEYLLQRMQLMILSDTRGRGSVQPLPSLTPTSTGD